jgi:uncharacterized protein (TIGR03435 family)
MRRIGSGTAAVAVGLLACGVLQTSASARQAATRDAEVFDVASIRPNTYGDAIHATGLLPGGRFIATNIPLRELIRLAYGLHLSQIAGGPDWITSARFDIVAQAAGSRPPSLGMIQRLLAERFKLTAHIETRTLPIFALVTAHIDGRPGPHLRASEVNCEAVMALSRAPASAFPQPGQRQLCDLFVGFAPRFEAGGVTMAQLAASLSRQVSRLVMDGTHLEGRFDLELQWTPDLPQQPAAAYRLNGIEVDPNGPSIVAALEEQLGLRLQPAEGSADVLVIDSVSQPAPDKTAAGP